MRGIAELVRTIGHGLKVAFGALFAGAVLWCIACRAFLGFTPPWLDEFTIGTTVAILLVAGILKIRDGRRGTDIPPDAAGPSSDASRERH